MASIVGTSSPDTLTGTTANDSIRGLAGDDSLSGLEGNDTLNGGVGNDTLDGGTGTDTATYVSATGAVTVNLITGTSSGADGADTLIGIENVTGSGFDDTLWANGQGNTLDGGNGNDTLVGINGIYLTKLIGGAGFDTADFSHMGSEANLWIDAIGMGMFDTSGIEKLIGTNYSDNIFGSANDDEIWAGGGNDIIYGFGGSDSLHGDAGDDKFAVEVGEATSNDLFDGGDGTDLVDFENTTSGVAVDLRLTTSQVLGAAMGSATFLSIENVNGTEADDTLHGTDVDNRLASGAGSDQLFGEGGNDTLLVTLGDKVIDGGSGNDTLWFADLPNTTPFSFSPPDLTVSLELQGQVQQTGAGALTLTNVENITGANANDTLTGDDNANALIGESGNDVLTGNAGNDFLEGDFGADQLFGGDGNDNLTGGLDDDQLYGGAGNDILDGGSGDDILVGGTGRDQFVGDFGVDTASFEEDVAAVNVNLAVGKAVGADGTELISEVENVVGSALDDRITGDNAANRIDGGLGADIMLGGNGNDTYVVDNVGDTVGETSASGGTDMVLSSVDFTLRGYVENLTLTGTADLRGNGNNLNNVLEGNAGINTLVGYNGDDTYIVNTVGDRAVESSASGGFDTVYSSVSFTLGSNVEQLALMESTPAFSAIGNTLDNILIGNSGANLLDGRAGADQMYGGGGNDTFIVDNVGDTVVGGAETDTVKASVSFTLGVDIDNLTLTGAAAINGTGNNLSNVIIGNAAANIIDGKGGIDLMKGGAGDDTYIVDDAADKVLEASTGGVDTVKSSVSLTLGSYLENLTLLGTGDLNGTGNSLANTILGTAGVNILDGGAGADTLKGFAGDDVYIVDNVGDVVIEAADAGMLDRVKASVSYTLGANIEQLWLTGTAAINGTGNGLDNYIEGNSNDNILDGGVGADTMSGGAGNDTYIVDNVGDYAFEQYDGGNDTVKSSISFSLNESATLALENVTLTGADAINAMGNSGVNILIGNGAANILDGYYGNDVMKGGAGDDTYIVWDDGDQVVETSTGGVDTVHSSVTNYTLTAYVENLILDVGQGNGTGNSLDNVITGSIGDNILDGKAGADTLIGGGGQDIFIVDNAGDHIIESSADFYLDTVLSSVTHTLEDNLEVLTLTGTAAISGTGNAMDNTISGNAAANTLSGLAGNDHLNGADGNDTLSGGAGDDFLLGGAGNDTIQGGDGQDILAGGVGADSLTGGLGVDSFVFDTALGGTNVDAITDFTHAGDLIGLSQDIFAAITVSGQLAATAFQAGTAANDAADRIIYDSATGRIYYDADGNGAGAKVLFATVTAGTVLTNADFVVGTGTVGAMALPEAKAAAADQGIDNVGLDLAQTHHLEADWTGDFHPYGIVAQNPDLI